MATVRIKKRASYRACSCCSNTVVSKGGSGRGIVHWWAIGRAHEQSSRSDLTINLEKKAPGWSDAKSSSSTTVYSKACEFDAVADLEELQIRKSPDWPNRHLQIRLRLQKPLDSIWSCNRTPPNVTTLINSYNHLISCIMRLSPKSFI